ncbi:XrtA/PEP-CTERM system TPR-repeat protein PrsT [Thalassotalea sp. G2M2-11]|uniref:XrtA/PEP-CTERM system TPR-repeat protein PrsT n=1 Tax=Thalassotalea sp. G2M2-11 TaxID=2787627 RepID=UPI0019D10CBD|nr:XrtA/PEP-CTERM system TPR-repeat protein PrsT [Thalassotalea sp. G2M2-11]
MKGIQMRITALPPLFFTFVILLWGCTENKDNDSLLADAKAFLEKGEVATATINLKNILQKNPTHSEARYLLGKIYLTNNNFLAAKKELRHAIAENPAHEKAILTLGQTYLSLTQPQEIINLLSTRTFQTTENNIRSQILLAQAHLHLNQLEQAKELVNSAVSADNNSKYSLFGQALIAAYEKKTNQALILLDSLMESYTDFVDAILLKASVLSNDHQYQQAAKTYLLYYQKKPQNFAVRTLVAHNLIKAGDYKAAKIHIDALRKINDKHPTINTLASQIAYVEQDFSLAKTLANQVFNATNSGLAQMISGLSSYQLGEFEQAYYQLNAITDSLPKNHQVNRILAILQVKLGYTDELDESLGAFSDDASFFADLGSEYVNLGDTEAAKKMFNSASNLAPNNAQLKTFLGIIKLAKDDDSGIKELQTAVELSPKSAIANIALAMNHVKQGEINKAQEIANTWLEKDPNSISGLILNGNIANHSGDKEQAIGFFKQALHLSPTNIIPVFNLAVIAAESGNIAESNAYLDQLFAIDLEYPYAYRLAINNAIKQNNEKLLEGKLHALIDSNPSAIWPRIILARRFNATGMYNKAEKLLAQLTNFKVLPNAYFKAVQNTLTKTKKFDQLIQTFTQWQQAQPNNASAYLSQVKLLERLGKYQDALTITRDALTSEPLKQNFQLKALEAYYLLATSQYSLAEKEIRRLSALQPEHAFVLRLQGQLAMAKSNFDKAIHYLRKSYHSNPKDETALFLVTSYRNIKETQKAAFLMEQLVNKHPNNIAFKKLLAELYITTSPNKAIISYENLLKTSPKSTTILNNLAWLYYKENKLSIANSYSQKAVELAPNNADILDTYGVILTKQNKLDDAIKVLIRANQQKPNDQQILTHLSLAYKANNQPELAEKL